MNSEEMTRILSSISEEVAAAATVTDKAMVIRRGSAKMGIPIPAITDAKLVDMWQQAESVSDAMASGRAAVGELAGYCLDPQEGGATVVLDPESTALAIVAMPEVAAWINAIPPVTDWTPDQLLRAGVERLVSAYVNATDKQAFRVLVCEITRDAE